MTKASKKIKNAELNRKYLILSRLNGLAYNDRQIAKNKLPIALNVSKRTFERWIYLSKDAGLEIPVDKIAIVAKYFGCSIEELINTPIPQYNTAQLKRLSNDSLALELGMVK